MRIKHFLLTGVAATILFPAVATAQRGGESVVLSGVEFSVDTLFHAKVGPGTTQTSLLVTSKEDANMQLRVFYTTTDLSTPAVSVEALIAQDKLSGGATVSSMATSHSTAEKSYFAGINTNFFVTSGTATNGVSKVGAPQQAAVSRGEIYLTSTAGNSGNRAWPNFFMDADGKPNIGAISYDAGTAECNGQSVKFTTVNNSANNNAVSVYTPKYYGILNQPSLNGSVAEVPAKMIEGDYIEFGKTVKLEVTGAATTTGDRVIPDGEYMIAGRGNAMSFVQNLQPGDVVTLTARATVDGTEVFPMDVATGNPWILENGEVLESEGDRGDASARHPRSSIGYSSDQSKLVMMVIDGRSALSDGVHTKELAGMMYYAGADEAINVDGGGSSTMYTSSLGVRNRPSDGHERACACGMFVAINAPEDNEIAEIRFEDWSLHFPKYGVYTPKVYGYNQYGVLVDTDVAATLSCDASLGEIIDEGRTFYGTGSGTAALKASYNGLEATLPVEILGASDGVAMTFRLANLLIDDVREYPVEINATMHENVMSINPQAFSWSSGDSGIATVGSEDGVVRGVSDGTTTVTGAVGDFTGVLNVTVEIPTSSAMSAVSGAAAEEWALMQSGGTGLTLTPEGEGFVLSYTGNGSGRGAYIQLTRSTRVWSLPDKIRMRIDANGAPVNTVQMSVTNALGETLSNWALTGEISESGETTLEGSISEWCDAEDIGVYPITINNIRFSMGASTKGQQFEMRVLGIDGIYDDFDAVSSIEARGGVRVWPNPVAGGETVRVEADGEAVVTVYGMNGSMVSETAIEGVGEVSTAGLAQGVYVVKVATASGIHTAKLIVK